MRFHLDSHWCSSQIQPRFQPCSRKHWNVGCFVQKHSTKVIKKISHATYSIDARTNRLVKCSLLNCDHPEEYRQKSLNTPVDFRRFFPQPHAAANHTRMRKKQEDTFKSSHTVKSSKVSPFHGILVISLWQILQVVSFHQEYLVYQTCLSSLQGFGTLHTKESHLSPEMLQKVLKIFKTGKPQRMSF